LYFGYNDYWRIVKSFRPFNSLISISDEDEKRGNMSVLVDQQAVGVSLFDGEIEV
jgi:hypothetical protein